MLNDRQINSIFKIAECGSINQAASKLYISSSALIQQLNIIEQQLGFKFFKRNTKGVELTEAGKYFVDETKLLYIKLNNIIDNAKEIEQTRSNKINIGYVSIIPEKPILDLYKSLKIYNKDLSVSLIRLDITEVNSVVDKEVVDCVLTPDIIRPEDKNYVSTRLLHNRPCICVTPDSPLSSKKRISINDLNDMDIVFPRRGRFHFYDKFEDDLRNSGIKFKKIEAVDYLLAEAYVDNAKRCRLATYTVEGSTLKYIPIKEDVYFNIYLLCKKDKYPSLIKYFKP